MTHWEQWADTRPEIGTHLLRHAPVGYHAGRTDVSARRIRDRPTKGCQYGSEVTAAPRRRCSCRSVSTPLAHRDPDPVSETDSRSFGQRQQGKGKDLPIMDSKHLAFQPDIAPHVIYREKGGNDRPHDS
jgi:hypothetical protein